MSSIAEIQMQDGSQLLLDARSRTESAAFWNGEYDQDDIDFFKVCTSFGKVAFDVGANVGLITVPLARHLRDNGGGRVVAFEPVISNFNRLLDAIELNGLGGIVLPFDVALGDEEGEIEMALETQGGAQTGNAMMRRIADAPSRFSISTARITRLDTFVVEQGISHVDFIKVDIEGADLLFIKGGQAFLTKCRPIIYGEFNSGMMPKFGHTFLDLIDFIRPWRYRVFGFAGRLQPVEVLCPTVGIGNVFLVPEEKANELLHRVAIARQKDNAA
jgi:FkbM family methyltransferase